MAADGTATGGIDQDVARNQVVADTIKIVSTSLLGLTVGCAQCHDHRYDPIPQADYYRLRAVFEPAYDWKHWRVPGERLVSLWTDADRAKAGRGRRRGGQQSRPNAQAKLTVYMDEALEKELAKFDDELHGALCAGLSRRPPPSGRAEQKKLLEPAPQRQQSDRRRALSVQPGGGRRAEEARRPDRRRSAPRGRFRISFRCSPKCPARSRPRSCSIAATIGSRRARSRPAG